MSNLNLIQQEDYDSIAQLQFLAQQVVQGISTGRHLSPHKGTSAEFKEHRQYVAGDEVRSIDWKLYGKTDRLFVRLHEDETNLRCMLLVDQSGSMRYAGTRARGISKHQFAVRLAACMATLLIKQQDAVGVATFDKRIRETIAPRARRSHLKSCLTTLAASRPGGETGIGKALQSSAAQLPRRGLIVMITDCFDRQEELVRCISALRQSGSEVIVFQILDRDEIDFPFQQRAQFESLESQQSTQPVDCLTMRTSYLERFTAFQTSIKASLASKSVELTTCTTDMDYATALSRYIACRSRRVSGQPTEQATEAHSSTTRALAQKGDHGIP